MQNLNDGPSLPISRLCRDDDVRERQVEQFDDVVILGEQTVVTCLKLVSLVGS